MKLLAILFVLPAALLRRVRKTKKGSVCDSFDDNSKSSYHLKEEDKIAGCLKNDD